MGEIEIINLIQRVLINQSTLQTQTLEILENHNKIILGLQRTMESSKPPLSSQKRELYLDLKSRIEDSSLPLEKCIGTNGRKHLAKMMEDVLNPYDPETKTYHGKSHCKSCICHLE